jgi:nicotinate-nucleotide adenylyltransferase
MSRDAAHASGQAGIGILGGTFDPVHFGHLRTALEVLEACGLESVRLMLSARPPHRPAPVAAVELRLAMLQAATAGESRLIVDERELRRPGPSYTVDSLGSLRAEMGAARPLCLLLGADAFLGLTSWHRWRDILGLAHLVVMRRPGWRLQPAGELADLLAARRDDDLAALRRPGGGVIRVQEVTALDISASAMREHVYRGGDPRFLTPDPVRDLILSTGCYREPPGPQEAQLRA